MFFIIFYVGLGFAMPAHYIEFEKFVIFDHHNDYHYVAKNNDPDHTVYPKYDVQKINVTHPM